MAYQRVFLFLLLLALAASAIPSCAAVLNDADTYASRVLNWAVVDLLLGWSRHFSTGVRRCICHVVHGFDLRHEYILYLYFVFVFHDVWGLVHEGREAVCAH